MSIHEYKRAFSHIEPSRETHDDLVEQILQEKRRAQRRSLKPRLAILCAVLMILGISTTAAAQAFDLNSVFQDFFKESSGTGGTLDGDAGIPLASDDSFLLSAGNAIHAETAANGLKLTVRGTVGDGNALYAAIDVETEDGAPFTKKQEGSLYSYRFGSVFLEVDGADGQYCGLTRIDDGSEAGKATFLLSETLEGELNGKEVRLTLEDLMMESNEVLDLGMEKTVWELMQEFPALTEADIADWGETISEDMNGVETREQTFLAKKLDQRTPFTPVYPEAALSNLGIWEGDYETSLLVNLEYGGEMTSKLLEQKGLLLIDKDSGQMLTEITMQGAGIGNGGEESVFPGMDGQVDIVGDQVISGRYQFNRVEPEALKNAVFALGGANSYEGLFEGSWQLAFTVEYKETLKTWDLAEKVTAGSVKIEKIQISPVSAILYFDTLSENNADFESVRLHLKDGTWVDTSSVSWEQKENEAGKCRLLWNSVINLDEVEEILVNESVIPL